MSNTLAILKFTWKNFQLKFKYMIFERPPFLHNYIYKILSQSEMKEHLFNCIP
jgi:hypothetical protein